MGAGEMIQGFKTLANLLENQSSVPSIPVRHLTTTYSSSSWGIPCLWLLTNTCIHIINDNNLTNKMNLKNIKAYAVFTSG